MLEKHNQARNVKIPNLMVSGQFTSPKSQFQKNKTKKPKTSESKACISMHLKFYHNMHRMLLGVISTPSLHRIHARNSNTLLLVNIQVANYSLD